MSGGKHGPAHVIDATDCAVETTGAVPVDPEERRADDFSRAFNAMWRDTLPLRKGYPWTLLAALCFEVAVSVVMLFGIGAGKLHIHQWVAIGFFGSVLGQVVGLTHIVVRNLFPTPQQSIAALYGRLSLGRS